MTKYGDEQKYTIDEWGMTKLEQNIKDGVISMVKTEIDEDHNTNDNSEYNKDRNTEILKALEKSIKLQNEVDDLDLYNQTLANKMK